MATKKIPRSELSPEALAIEHAKDKARREYDKERILARQRSWYQANIDRMRPYYAERSRANNPRYKEKKSLYNREYAAKHRERLQLKRKARPESAKERERANAKRWRAEHLERAKANNTAWIKANPEKIKVGNSRNRARRANAPINDFTDAQWEFLCKAARYRCCYCGDTFKPADLTPDHLTPYAKQGSNTLHNILPCCGRCNSAKRDRDVPTPVQPFLLVEAD